MDKVTLNVSKHGKGSRLSSRRVSRPPKRKYHPPKKTSEGPGPSKKSTTSEQKLRRSAETKVKTRKDCSFVIIDFEPVFSAISEVVKCKDCDGDIAFEREDVRGLGFKLIVKCANCEQKAKIPNCPMIGEQGRLYELNLRSVLGMRMLGQGQAGLETFQGIMDLPPPLTRNANNEILKKILEASETVVQRSMSNAAIEEVQLTKKAGNIKEEGAVAASGDGSWRKRGHVSHHGIATLIGQKSNKVLDKQVKATYCQECKQMEHLSASNPEEYIEWLNTHATECKATHEGSSGKMETDSILDMFRRSEEKHGIKYIYFIGDGDAANYKAICDAKPYGDTEIKKKECVMHVQKRMGRRLMELKKSWGSTLLADKKSIGGKGRLTASLIQELQDYYGKAIRDNINDKDAMNRAIWATLYHRASTDQSPQHHLCLEGDQSWCKWQRAKATGQQYCHKNVLPPAIVDLLKPIYEDLSNPGLLERCLGGYNQNNNESLHSKVWKLAPKTLFSETDTVETALNIGVAIFNDGMTAVIKIMEEMGIQPGPRMEHMCRNSDVSHIQEAEKRAQEITKEARKQRRQEREIQEEEARQTEGALYSAGAHD